ncbi:hypothetical protein KCU95_g10252, partial [Aureobasidium melanogenum]
MTSVDASDLSNLSIGDTSELEGEDEKNKEPEDPDNPDQDTFETIDGKRRAEAAMASLKLICKHQSALSSLTKEKGKGRSKMLQSLSLENNSVKLEHKDNQMEQPSGFL